MYIELENQKKTRDALWNWFLVLTWKRRYRYHKWFQNGKVGKYSRAGLSKSCRQCAACFTVQLWQALLFQWF